MTSPSEPYVSGGDCYDAPGRVIVAFDNNLTDSEIRDFISNLGLTISGAIFGVTERWALVIVPEGTEDEWIIALKEHEIVTTAERDSICPVHE